MVNNAKKVIAIIVVFMSVILGFLMRTLGKHTWGNIILTLVIIYLILGILYFLYWRFIKNRIIEKKEYQLSVEEAKAIARVELQQNGIIQGEEYIATVKSVGEVEKQPFFFWIFSDYINSRIKVAYYINLKTPIVKGKLFGTSDEQNFYERALNELKNTASPIKEQQQYIIKKYDMAGNLIAEEIGSNPQQTVIPEMRKGEVEIVDTKKEEKGEQK